MKIINNLLVISSFIFGLSGQANSQYFNIEKAKPYQKEDTLENSLQNYANKTETEFPNRNLKMYVWDINEDGKKDRFVLRVYDEENKIALEDSVIVVGNLTKEIRQIYEYDLPNNKLSFISRSEKINGILEKVETIDVEDNKHIDIKIK